MSKILKVTPDDDYTLLVEFEHGNKIIFNMRYIIKTMPFSSLEDLSRFKDITLEEKAICWPEPVPDDKSIIPPAPDGGQHAVYHTRIMNRRRKTNEDESKKKNPAHTVGGGDGSYHGGAQNGAGSQRAEQFHL